MPNRTYFGGMVTNLNRLNNPGYDNQVFAFDGQIGIGEISQIDGFVTTSSTPNLDSNKAYSYRLSASRNAQSVQTAISYQRLANHLILKWDF